MSNRHSLVRIPARDGRALKAYCLHDDRSIRVRETGDHVIVEGPRGSAVFPDREMGTGLWHQVIKSIISIGLGVLVILVLAALLPL